MRVFITGASGHIASAVIPELVSAGHAVTGLARSDRSAAVVQSLGAEVGRGELDDLDGLSMAVREADGVIHLAFNEDEVRSGNMAGAIAADLRAIEAMGAALAGTDKPFIGTSPTGAMAMAGFQGLLTEQDTLPGGPRDRCREHRDRLCRAGRAIVGRPPAAGAQPWPLRLRLGPDRYRPRDGHLRLPR
jgi:nucleoside-diphosphate-sugar epimerase